MSGSHNAENLCSEITTHLKEWDMLTKCVAMTTDNAANIKAAIELSDHILRYYVLPACNKRAAKIINTVKKCIIPHSGKSVAHTLVIRAVALMPMCLKTRNKLWLHTKVGRGLQMGKEEVMKQIPCTHYCDKIMDFYFCHDVLMKNQAQEQMEHNKTEIVHNALDPEWEPEGVQKDHEPCDEDYVLPACNKRAAKIINTVKKCIIPHSGKSVAHTLVIRAVALMPMCLKTRNKLWLHTKVGRGLQMGKEENVEGAVVQNIEETVVYNTEEAVVQNIEKAVVQNTKEAVVMEDNAVDAQAQRPPFHEVSNAALQGVILPVARLLQERPKGSKLSLNKKFGEAGDIIEKKSPVKVEVDEEMVDAKGKECSAYADVTIGTISPAKVEADETKEGIMWNEIFVMTEEDKDVGETCDFHEVQDVTGILH
ncbi:hypothetical protein CAPTEDRAFT_209562 [Capitella teleta]|uniref:DUF659 domain-containing protein n=1 Tax=Capitella teleta TaxID=283909 RepID=R7UKS3_CAPTE|nr:hypothetical protein CAPTEDRAFT_209562 [Capitella teleta]|eukprot:ELU03867.1 hypothetical protein CAPTEDRAFT_209562 [Capitella teleta]